MRTKRGFTPLEIARGQNNVVSSKPAVAAVLERAETSTRKSLATPAVQVSVTRQSSTGGGNRMEDHNITDGGIPSKSAAISMKRSQREERPPSVTTHTAASAEAITALQCIDLVRDERAAMERVVVTAQRDVQRRAAVTRDHPLTRPFEPSLHATDPPSIAWKQVEHEDKGVNWMLKGCILSVAVAGLLLLMAKVFFVAISVGLIVGLVTPIGIQKMIQRWQAQRRPFPAFGTDQPWPAQFLCPITGEVMNDPVTTADGHTFERAAIERWLQAHDTSPMTGATLAHTQLAPALAIRQLISLARAQSHH